MTPEDEATLRRDGLCRTCGRACWPLHLTSDHLCVSCCEKERDALTTALNEIALHVLRPDSQASQEIKNAVEEAKRR